ncbi:MAG TPA: glycerol-3-phosphate dehydrogenase/oxidase [Candidatus Nanopelagicaceae bacterium]|nr:glycerol-3-phosphate dehydrogenase/oxidase [Candidatus Nanopelagicaceae bacterium]
MKSTLNPAQRDAALVSLAENEFDLLVVGGGVNGCGAALDAATRGLKVAMIELGDFASGTSSRSSKLIHGGLRYLEQYDFKLVREALKERELMVGRTAPHLVSPVSFLYPLHEPLKERGYVGAGLMLYDALRGREHVLPYHRHVSVRRMRQIAPGLRPDVLRGGVLYYDAQVDDARHTLMLARTASMYGATIASRVECLNLLRDGESVVGAVVRDVETGRQFEIRAKVSALAAGVWSDGLHARAGITPGYSVTMSKGVHITVPRSAIDLDTGVILRTEVSVLFIIPWKNEWLIGTTDTPWIGDCDNPLATPEDIDYLLEQANRILLKQLRESDIIGVFVGLRPLVASTQGSPTTQISREHIVDHPMPGLVSVAGGKYTTYRIMARDLVDAGVADLDRKVPESCTEDVLLMGADGFAALQNRAELLADEYGVSREIIAHLLGRYGSLFEEVLELAAGDNSLLEPISPSLEYLRVEILYSVFYEGARSIEDVLARRTRIAFEASDGGLSLAKDVSELIAGALSWSPSQVVDEIAKYRTLIEGQRQSALGPSEGNRRVS